MPSFYYLDSNRQPVGPMKLDDIRKLVGAGVVEPETLVCREGEEDWKAISDWSEPATDCPGPPRVPPPTQTSSPAPLSRSQASDLALPSWLAPTAMAAGIASLLTTFLPVVALVIAIPAIIGGILALRHPGLRGRGLALIAVFTGGVGALPALSFLLGMSLGMLDSGGGEAAAIEQVLTKDQAINQEAKSRFPNDPSKATRYIAENMQGIDTTQCPPEFRLAFQQHVNAWAQAAPYIEADTPLTAFFESLYAGATEDFRALGQSNQQAQAAKEQINATHREVLNIAVTYGARIPVP